MSWQLNSSILAGSVDIYSEFASTASVDLVQTFFGSCGYAVFIAVVWNERMFVISNCLFPIVSNLVISLGKELWQCLPEVLVSLSDCLAYLPMSLSNQRPSGPGLGTSGRLHRAWSWVCFYRQHQRKSASHSMTHVAMRDAFCNQGFQFRVLEALCNKSVQVIASVTHK